MSAEDPTTEDLLTAARKVAVRRQMHRNAVDHKLRAETACDAARDALADAMRDLDELLERCAVPLTDRTAYKTAQLAAIAYISPLYPFPGPPIALQP